jgi:hypothetical protein
VRTLVLDKEAVGALADPGHPKHRVVLAHLSGVVVRRRRGVTTTVVVPTAVRVEAGWDRRTPRAASLNRLRIADMELDTAAADVAAQIVADTGVSVADAHIGAVVRSTSGAGNDVIVLTSDPRDISRAAGDAAVVALRI